MMSRLPRHLPRKSSLCSQTATPVTVANPSLTASRSRLTAKKARTATRVQMVVTASPVALAAGISRITINKESALAPALRSFGERGMPAQAVGDCQIFGHLVAPEITQALES